MYLTALENYNSVSENDITFEILTPEEIEELRRRYEQTFMHKQLSNLNLGIINQLGIGTPHHDPDTNT